MQDWKATTIKISQYYRDWISVQWHSSSFWTGEVMIKCISRTAGLFVLT